MSQQQGPSSNTGSSGAASPSVFGNASSMGSGPGTPKAFKSTVESTPGHSSASAATTTPQKTAGAPPANSASAPPPAAAPTNFRQFESAVEKLNIDVTEGEKEFITHATRSNYYDQIIHSNGQKISNLAENLEGLKKEQMVVENILEHVKETQNDMEAIVLALEASFPAQVLNTSDSRDLDRSKILSTTVRLDEELQQMSSDLMEVINHANLKNKTKSTDPISQIVSVMNEHTDMLAWVDEAANTMKGNLDALSKTHKDCRQTQETAVRLMFATEKK